MNRLTVERIDDDPEYDTCLLRYAKLGIPVEVIGGALIIPLNRPSEGRVHCLFPSTGVHGFVDEDVEVFLLICHTTCQRIEKEGSI